MAWGTAERTAVWVGARAKMPAPYRPDLLEADFEELTAKAEELVAGIDRPALGIGTGPGAGDRPGGLGAGERRLASSA